jgi:hypothetical protein
MSDEPILSTRAKHAVPGQEPDLLDSPLQVPCVRRTGLWTLGTSSVAFLLRYFGTRSVGSAVNMMVPVALVSAGVAWVSCRREWVQKHEVVRTIQVGGWVGGLLWWWVRPLCACRASSADSSPPPASLSLSPSGSSASQQELKELQPRTARYHSLKGPEHEEERRALRLEYASKLQKLKRLGLSPSNNEDMDEATKATLQKFEAQLEAELQQQQQQQQKQQQASPPLPPGSSAEA